jgi:hypothetical protein
MVRLKYFNLWSKQFLQIYIFTVKIVCLTVCFILLFYFCFYIESKLYYYRRLCNYSTLIFVVLIGLYLWTQYIIPISSNIISVANNFLKLNKLRYNAMLLKFFIIKTIYLLKYSNHYNSNNYYRPCIAMISIKRFI